jgi:capsular polysaccharide biosynthesis protein
VSMRFPEQREPARGGTRYLRALREHWPFIALTVIAALLAAGAYTSLAAKRYEAAADILVSPVSSDDPAFTGLPVIRESVESRSVVTVARLLRSPQVADAVRSRLGLDLDREALLERIEVRPQEQSNIVTVIAEGDTPTQARQVANGFAEALLAERKAQFDRAARGVLQRLSSAPGDAGAARAERISVLRGLLGAGDPTLQLASEAVAPSKPSWPRPALSLAVALLAGLLIGMGIAVGLEIVSPLVLQEDQLATYGAAIIARVPRARREQLRTLIEQGRLPRDLIDHYRLLCAQVARGPTGFPQSVLVTGPSSAVDRATVAFLLARVSGRDTAFVDADLRHGTLSSLLSDSGPKAKEALPRRVQDVELAGRDGEDLEAYRSGSELLVIDAPSPSESAEAFWFATQVDRVLVVVRLGRTRHERLDELMDTLANAGIAASFVVVGRRIARGESERLEAVSRPTVLSSSG